MAASSNLARISFPSEVTSPAPMVMIKSFGLAPAIANSIAATIDGSKSTLVPISRICLAITELLAPDLQLKEILRTLRQKQGCVSTCAAEKLQ